MIQNHTVEGGKMSKQNRKGMELGINVVILVIIALVVLAVLLIGVLPKLGFGLDQVNKLLVTNADKASAVQ